MRRSLMLTAAVVMAGCSHYEPLSLHGAASMRVEVEVYKGPLTSPIQGQIGELVAELSDSVRALDDWRTRAQALSTKLECKTSTSEDCRTLRVAITSAGAVFNASCFVVNSPTIDETFRRTVYLPKATCGGRVVKERKSDAPPASAQDIELQLFDDGTVKAQRQEYAQYSKDLGPDVDDLEKSIRKCISGHARITERLICEADTIGVQFDNLSALTRGAGNRVLESLVPRAPQAAEIRSLLVEYANLAAEHGERIHARVTVIQKLLPEDGATEFRDPRTLPVSDYLRSASRSDYIQLYDWLSAVSPDGDRDSLSPAERIRMAQRLTADSYWQKVNEVYASGQGDVAMAFVKDELGNWDLKSFSNDPSELLASYRKVTDAALKTAVSLTRKAALGPVDGVTARMSNAQRAASLANQFATGEVAATPGVVAGVNIDGLHDRTAERISAQKTRFQTLETRLTQERDEQAKAVVAATQAKIDADAAFKGADAGLAAARADRDTWSAALSERIAALNAKKAAEPTNTKAEEAQVSEARLRLAEAQASMDSRQADVLKARAAQDAADAKKAEADAKQAAAEQRLAELPKEAIEAVRGTLDDHLSVIAALQDGVASSASPKSDATSGAPSP